MKIFYFTATGNSLYVAKKIGGELHSIPQLIKTGENEFEDEAIGFVFPCYWLGIPRIVRKFIEESKFKANYFFTIITYGNMAASELKQIEQIGASAGIQFNYTNEVLMINNNLPGFKIEKQLEKESLKKIQENLNQIIMDISERKKYLTRRGIVSDVLSGLTRNYNLKSRYDYCDELFLVQDNCNSCKICEKVCPVNNIKVETKPVYSHKCEGCYACIHHCPQKAINLKSQKSKARFINQNIKLKEIIEANNQSNPS